MVRHRPTSRPFRPVVTAVATAALAVGTLAGCGTDSTATADKSDPKTGAAAAKDTHDGAVPIAVVAAYMDAFGHGNGDLVCGFSTLGHQQALTDQAIKAGVGGKNPSCADAVAALHRSGRVPAPVIRYEVKQADAETTVLVLHREKTNRQSAARTQTATLTAAGSPASDATDTDTDADKGDDKGAGKGAGTSTGPGAGSVAGTWLLDDLAAAK